jgi:hypothetical protein
MRSSGSPHSVATARAHRLLPQPGTPMSSSPRGNVRPKPAAAPDLRMLLPLAQPVLQAGHVGHLGQRVLGRIVLEHALALDDLLLRSRRAVMSSAVSRPSSTIAFVSTFSASSRVRPRSRFEQPRLVLLGELHGDRALRPISRAMCLSSRGTPPGRAPAAHGGDQPRSDSCRSTSVPVRMRAPWRGPSSAATSLRRCTMTRCREAVERGEHVEPGHLRADDVGERLRRLLRVVDAVRCDRRGTGRACATR